MANFEIVKEYLLDMGFSIDQEDSNEELVAGEYEYPIVGKPKGYGAGS